MAEVTPLYKHDCGACVYLGRFYHEGVDYDLYSCPGGSNPTLIARYGSDGREYMSGRPFIGILPPITEAAKRETQQA